MGYHEADRIPHCQLWLFSCVAVQVPGSADTHLAQRRVNWGEGRSRRNALLSLGHCHTLSQACPYERGGGSRPCQPPKPHKQTERKLPTHSLTPQRNPRSPSKRAVDVRRTRATQAGLNKGVGILTCVTTENVYECKVFVCVCVVIDGIFKD